VVRRKNGHLRLRIDDLDSTRSRDEWIEDCFETLESLGIDFDDGPSGVEEFKKRESQTLFQDQYWREAEKLIAQKKAYPCECSRKDIEKTYPDGVYQGNCRNKELSSNLCAYRFLVDKEKIDVSGKFVEVKKEVGDFVLFRKDGLAAYHLVSVIEDQRHLINTIVRGEDLLASSGAQILLAEALGYADFKKIKFIHHPLLFRADGKKLSKSQNAPSLLEILKSGNFSILYCELEKMLNLEIKITSIRDLLLLDESDFESKLERKNNELD